MADSEGGFLVVQAVDRSEALRPFVPELALEWLAERPDARDFHVEGTLAFVDISGFTSLTERLSRKGKIGAEELKDVLDEVFGRLLEVAYADGAGLLKWGGDAVLLLFRGPDHAARACHAAFGMRRVLRKAGQVRTSVGKVSLKMSVGIHSGTFDLFLAGEDHRELIITGLGATRTAVMETIAEAGEIALSEQTAALLDPALLGDRKDEAILLGAEPKVRIVPVEEAHVPGGEEIASLVPIAVREHLLDASREPEHRQLTIAFIEFSNVGELLERDGADAVADDLERLIRSAQRACREHQVSFFQTDISKDGGKVILMAGAPRSAGEDEERMLLAARQIMDEPGALPLRIGINSGYVFTGDFGPSYRRTYDIKGDAINLAARVMAKAERGQIVATPAVFTRSNTRFERTELEPFLVKGKRDAIRASVIGAIAGSAEQESGLHSLPLVGRDQEVVLLSAAIDDARAGTGRMVELVGPAGIGKTRLLSDLRDRASGFVQISSNCELYQASTPYAALRPILREAIGLPESAAGDGAAAFLRERVADLEPDLLPLLPFVALPIGIEVEPTPEVEAIYPQFRKQHMEAAIEGLLRAALTDPTLIAIEDVHWMDDVSRDVVVKLGTSVHDLPWLICTTRRDQQTGLYELPGESPISLRLEPLEHGYAAALLRLATEEAPLRPDQIRSLAARSGGNPLFLKELVLAARTSGIEHLPDSIESLVTVQIDRLSATDRRILRRAAVLGAVFSDDLVAALFDRPDDRPDEAAWLRLDEFVVEEAPGRRRFRHALMRDAAYEGLTFRRRNELHARAAEALLEANPTSREEVAELLSLHFHKAQMHSEAWVHSRVAGDRANDKYANSEAVTFYMRAIESAGQAGGTPHDVAELLELVGDVQWRMAAFVDAATSFTRARRLLQDEPAKRATLLLKQAKISYRAGAYGQAVRLLRTGLRTVEGSGRRDQVESRVRLLAMLAAVRGDQGRLREAEALSREVVASARGKRLREALAHAYEVLDFVHSQKGDYRDEFLAKALKINHRSGDLFLEAEVLNLMGINDYYRGKWSDAVERWERSRALKAQIGDDEGAAVADANIGEVLSDQGHLAEAEAKFRDALQVFRASGTGMTTGTAFSNLARVAARSRRFDAAEALYVQAEKQLRTVGDQGQLIENAARLAELRLLEGSASDALQIARETLAKGGRDSEALPQAPMLMRIAGSALARMGQLMEAQMALDDSIRVAREREAAYELGLSLRASAEFFPGEPDSRSIAAEAQEILLDLGVLDADHDTRVLESGAAADLRLSS